MKRRASLATAVFFGLTLLASVSIAAVGGGTADASEVRVNVGGGTFNLPVTSVKEARFNNVIQQQYDYSCGAASVATLLTYHYDRPTDERDVFEMMYEVGDQQAIQQDGFSLLDMKSYLESIGLRADGFEMSIETLAEIGVPAITLVNIDGYRHFVVVKGVEGGQVLVGDPALGLNIQSVQQFESVWSGIAFLIRDQVEIARANFNREAEWSLRPATPYANAANRRSLSTFSLLFKGRNEF